MSLTILKKNPAMINQFKSFLTSLINTYITSVINEGLYILISAPKFIVCFEFYNTLQRKGLFVIFMVEDHNNQININTI